MVVFIESRTLVTLDDKVEGLAEACNKPLKSKNHYKIFMTSNNTQSFQELGNKSFIRNFPTQRLFFCEAFFYIEKGFIHEERKRKGRCCCLGTEFIKFPAALAFLHQDDYKILMKCTRTIGRIG